MERQVIGFTSNVTDMRLTVRRRNSSEREEEGRYYNNNSNDR